MQQSQALTDRLKEAVVEAMPVASPDVLFDVGMTVLPTGPDQFEPVWTLVISIPSAELRQRMFSTQILPADVVMRPGLPEVKDIVRQVVEALLNQRSTALQQSVDTVPSQAGRSPLEIVGGR